ncbi:MAG TPA: efflux RND transporter periplasmic adaptor subunit [Candidatus Angelobacter sp.]
MKPTIWPCCRWLTIALLPVTAMALLAGCSGKKAQATGPGTVPVVVAIAQQKDVPVEVTAIGNVEAFSTVSVKSMVNGEITAVHFQEGQDVRKGQLLFSIDRRPFEAELHRLEGNLAKDSAQAQNAVVQARRYQALFKEGVVAREQYDQVQSNAEAMQAGVLADRAAVENARVQLQYTSIFSPIDGRTGNLLVHLGNVVKANDTPPLVVINQVKPIYVNFAVPEQYLADIKRYMAAGNLPVAASIPNDKAKPAEGKLRFVDNTVDPTTGTIKLKGTFANTDRKLWPGQFVNVVLKLATQANAVVVPSQAIQNGQQGQFVFVVKPDMTVESRPVVAGRTIEGQVVVDKGVQAGEKVVTDGQLRLSPGAKVEIKAGGESQPGTEGQGPAPASE